MQVSSLGQISFRAMSLEMSFEGEVRARGARAGANAKEAAVEAADRFSVDEAVLGGIDPAAGEDRLEIRGRVSLQVSLLEFHRRSAMSVGEALGGAPDAIREAMNEAFGVELPEEPDGWLDRMRALYTPEKTARRIFAFAASGYGRVQGDLIGESDGTDTVEARARFRDFILPAIERGYGEARAMLGELDGSIGVELESTLDLVRKLFEDFVAGRSVADLLNGDADAPAEGASEPEPSSAAA